MFTLSSHPFNIGDKVIICCKHLHGNMKGEIFIVKELFGWYSVGVEPDGYESNTVIHFYPTCLKFADNREIDYKQFTAWNISDDDDDDN